MTDEVLALLLRELLGPEVREEHGDWDELLAHFLYSEKTSRVVYSRVHDEDLIADLIQETYLHLRERDAFRLRAFRGESGCQFGAYLRAVVKRFLQKELHRIRCRRKREERILIRKHQSSRARSFKNGEPRLGVFLGASDEAEVARAFRELEELLTSEDRCRIEMISPGIYGTPMSDGRPCDGLVPTERTRRRWSEQLYRKYAHQLNLD